MLKNENFLDKYKNFITKWDYLIRNGHGNKVRSQLKQFPVNKIPRSLLVEYAQIARRVGAPDLIIRLLRPYVRSEKLNQANQATDSEKALYALGLFRLGAFREATILLKSCQPVNDPQINFYRASLEINQWNYQKAIPNLRRYIRDKRVPLYSKLVGRLNLCASLVSNGDLLNAEKLIEKTMIIAEKKKNILLKGNLREIQSQLYVELNQLDKALHCIEQASIFLQGADDRTRLYVEKWRTIIELKLKSSNSTLSSSDEIKKSDPFKEIKKIAYDIQDWETLRDCDLSYSIFTKNESLFLKVYWGSLHQAYRTRISRLYGNNLQINNTFEYKLKDPTEIDIKLDLVEKAPTRNLKKLFFIMTRDFYRPLQITEIIDYIYNEEYYNPITSHQKMHQLIKRGRQWLSKNNYPLIILSHRNSFKIEATKPCTIILRSFLENTSNLSINLPSDFNKDKIFTVKDWAILNQISTRTASRQINYLLQKSKIKKCGFGSQSRYQWIS